MAEKKSSATEWHRLAKSVAAKINVAWWLEKLAVPLMITALVAACLILLTRREVTEFPWLGVAITGGVVTLSLGLLAWWLARRHFESPADALVRIEASMKMRNGLTAARQGVTPWPDVPNRIDDGTRWHWPRLLGPLAAAFLFVAASLLLPVSARTDPEAPRQEPQAWRDIEADLEALAEDDTVQEEYLEEMEERIEELRQQKEEEWYSHSSLEATDSLEKMHSSELERVEQSLKKAERALQGLQKHGANLGEGARNQLLNEFDQALNGLDQGMMKPNKQLLEQLQQLDPKNLGNLDQEQLDQLRENMKKHAEACKQCQGNGQGQGGGNGGGGDGGEDWLDELLNEGDNPGDGEGQGQGDPSQPGQGKGGVNRGPGTAPNVLGRLGGDVKTGDLEGLESKDLSNTLPGDLLELTDGEHEVDESKQGLRAGGDIENKGEGGDRIWKDSLLPEEKKALREFFK